MYKYYFKYRLPELIVWLGVPLVGFFYAPGPIGGKEFIFFFSGTVLFMGHILLFNDWGGLVKNPLEAARYASKDKISNIQSFLLTASMVSLFLSFFLFAQISGFLAILVLIGGILSALYSHPGIHWKENLFLSKLLHLLGGEVKFLMGYGVYSHDMIRGIWIGLFYASVFIAGNLIHESVDLKEDQRGGLKTGAVRLGREPLINGAFILFICAHLYLAVLAAMNLIGRDDLLIFSFPVIYHLKHMAWIWSGDGKKIDPVQYKKDYRVGYAVSAVMFILKQVLYYYAID